MFRWRLGCAEVRLVLEALLAHRSHLLQEHGPGDSPGGNAEPPPRHMLRCRRSWQVQASLSPSPGARLYLGLRWPPGTGLKFREEVLTRENAQVGGQPPVTRLRQASW